MKKHFELKVGTMKVTTFHNKTCVSLYVGEDNDTSYYHIDLNKKDAIKLRDDLSKWIKST